MRPRPDPGQLDDAYAAQRPGPLPQLELMVAMLCESTRRRNCRVRSSRGSPRIWSGGPARGSRRRGGSRPSWPRRGRRPSRGSRAPWWCPPGQPADDLQHLAGQLGVEGGGDLVEQQQGRVGGQRAGHCDPLLLAAGEPVGVPVALSARPKPSSSSGACASASARARPCTLRGARVTLSSTDQVREQVVGLEDDAHPAAYGARVDARVGDVAALEPDRPVVDVLQQVEAAQQRRLARARRADQADDVVRARPIRSMSRSTTLSP